MSCCTPGRARLSSCEFRASYAYSSFNVAKKQRESNAGQVPSSAFYAMGRGMRGAGSAPVVFGAALPSTREVLQTKSAPEPALPKRVSRQDSGPEAIATRRTRQESAGVLRMLFSLRDHAITSPHAEHSPPLSLGEANCSEGSGYGKRQSEFCHLCHFLN